MNNKEIIYIEVNDWDDVFETEKCKRFVDNINTNSLNEIVQDADFNFYMTNYDMATFFLIVGTADEIKNCGYGELLMDSNRIIVDWESRKKYKLGLYDKKDFPEYDPSKWHTNENGQYKSIY